MLLRSAIKWTESSLERYPNNSGASGALFYWQYWTNGIEGTAVNSLTKAIAFCFRFNLWSDWDRKDICGTAQL